MISVIIPIYNVESYLEKCIRSILNNTYTDLEIICINDGSPDGCLPILRRLASEDSRIIIIDQENQGVPAARNNGIKKAAGEYIAFIDSDDWVHPQYFRSMLECMEQNQADLAICNCQKFSEKESITVENDPHISYQKLSDEQFFKDYYARHMCWGRIYRRKDIENIWFEPSIQSGEDTLFNLNVLSKIKKPVVYKTDVPLYFYFQREDSIVHTAKYETMIDIANWAIKYYHFNDQYEWSWMLLMQAIKTALSYRYGASLHKDSDNQRYADQTLKILIREMMKIRRIRPKEKMVHWVMYRFPAIYRQFRIKDDPSLLIWEKDVADMLSKDH